jgi:hypothetical protein
MFCFEDAELFDEQLICHGVPNPPHCFDSGLLLLYKFLLVGFARTGDTYLLVEPATINGRFCVPSYGGLQR